MNRSTRTLIVIAVATVTAAIASFGVYAAIRSIPVREVEVAHNFIAVAAKNLPTGSRLTEKDVKLVAWPSKNQVPGAFTKVESVVNRGLISGVVENEPLTESKLAPLSSGAGLPPTIPPGMRAMSVKVDEVVGVAGFVVPGTRVDVVVTMKRLPNSEQPMSRTVLSNVLVLTAGTKFDQEQAKGGEPQKSTVVTLALLPADAERIALAASEGKISLGLRNPLDVNPTQTNGIQVSNLMGGGTAAAPKPEPPVVPAVASRPRAAAPRPAPAVAEAPLPKSSIYTVEAIRAAKRSEEVVH
jgi:pilus assembly protein CpaB